jgi:hypothetical protein
VVTATLREVTRRLPLVGLVCFIAVGVSSAVSAQPSVSRSITLSDGWIFQPDPLRVGDAQKWQRPDFDRSGWRPVTVPMAWDHYDPVMDAERDGRPSQRPGRRREYFGDALVGERAAAPSGAGPTIATATVSPTTSRRLMDLPDRDVRPASEKGVRPAARPL